MHETTLDILRCPYCGTALTVVENTALRRSDAGIDAGILGCECCAFPVVDGIPILVADDATRLAMHALESVGSDEARRLLLGLDAADARRFDALQKRPTPPTFLETLAILSQDAEADYLAYRWSDPSYLTGAALLQTIGATGQSGRRPRLDVCGGAGHLTRVLANRRVGAPTTPAVTVALDQSFYKLWLAGRFTAPGCIPICCDANHPLPFVADSFGLVVLSDAFPYIWHKRLLANELMRLAGPDGTIVMPHLHSALGVNVSAGDTLTPDAYRDLLAPQQARLFSDARLLDQFLADQLVDLTEAESPHDLAGQPTLTLIASQHDEVFRRYELADDTRIEGELRVNPLYRTERRGDVSVLTLNFPTPEYAEEFSACRRYLPDTITLPGDLSGPITRSSVGPDYATLRRRHVLLDLPPHYC